MSCFYQVRDGAARLFLGDRARKTPRSDYGTRDIRSRGARHARAGGKSAHPSFLRAPSRTTLSSQLTTVSGSQVPRSRSSGRTHAQGHAQRRWCARLPHLRDTRNAAVCIIFIAATRTPDAPSASNKSKTHRVHVASRRNASYRSSGSPSPRAPTRPRMHATAE